jgi:hypothetical protein
VRSPSKPASAAASETSVRAAPPLAGSAGSQASRLISAGGGDDGGDPFGNAVRPLVDIPKPADTVPQALVSIAVSVAIGHRLSASSTPVVVLRSLNFLVLNRRAGDSTVEGPSPFDGQPRSAVMRGCGRTSLEPMGCSCCAI